jgi:hypothetical protein
VTAVGPLEPAEDRTLVIDDVGTLSLHLPCDVLGVVIGPRHVHSRSSECMHLCDEAAHHIVRCDDIASHVGPHRARYHSGMGWPVGYFTETLEAPTSEGDVGASAFATAGTEPEPTRLNVAHATDTRPLGAAVLGLAFGTASGLLLAAAYGLWTGVL